MVVKGPKALLAESIAAALSEYFEVEADNIQSNLLKNTKIVLNDTKLRPQTNYVPSGTNSLQALTTGAVDQVEFSWEWSIGSETIVKDATLTIRGLKFKAELSFAKDNPEPNNVPLDSKPTRRKSELQQIKKEGRVQAYIRRQVEQIINALTLNVTDFEFSLLLPPEGGVVGGISVGGQSVELKSLLNQAGKDELSLDGKHHLKNQLTFGSFSVNITKSELGSVAVDTYPLLQPISYRAIATRFSGKRFGGLNSGLEVVGLSLPSVSMRKIMEDRGVVFHAGVDQIQVLSQLGNLVLASSAASRQAVGDVALPESIDGPKGGNGDLQGNVRAGEDSSTTDDQLDALMNEVLTASVFHFPVTGVSLVLPNDTNITLESFTLNYQADGTVMNVMGTDGSGILVDDYHLVRTNSSSSSRWLVDFISSKFSITGVDLPKSDDTGSAAYFHLRPDVLKSLVEGMKMMAEAAGEMDFSSSAPKDNPPPPSTSPGWAFEVNSCIELRLEGSPSDSNPEFIVVSVDSPSMKMPFGNASCIQCSGLIVGPCSHGNLSVAIPGIKQKADSAELDIDGTVTAVVESSEVAQNAQDFLNDFLSAVKPSDEINATNDQNGSSTAQDASNASSFDGFVLSLPKINFATLEPNTQVIMHDVRLSSSRCSVNSINVSDDKGTTASVSGLRAVFSDQDKFLDVDMIESLHVPNYAALLNPIRNAHIGLEDKTLVVKLNSVDGMWLVDKRKAEDAEEAESKPVPSLPFPVKLSVNRLSVKKEPVMPKTDESDKAKQTKKEPKDIPVFMYMKGLEIGVIPTPTAAEVVEHEGKLISVTHPASLKFMVEELENPMVQLREASVSAVVDLDEPKEEVRRFRFGSPHPIKIQAGFSAVDWKGMFRGNNAPTHEPNRMPHAHVDKIELAIAYDFKIVTGKDTSVEISAFDGDSETTSASLIEHYASTVKKYAPDFITNTDIMGANVVDTGLAAYGAYALKATPYGGAAVGILGVAGVDAVFGALRAGKRSRGASRDEGYKPGDFCRGIVFLMSEATVAGAERRGGDDGAAKNRYVNFAIGAAHGAGGYVDDNKAQLGGAAAAGVGMVVGTMVAGPVGGIAGGVLAGAVTTKTIQHVENKSKAESTDEDDLSSSQHDEEIEALIPDPEVVESIKQKPQGLLYKRRDTFKSQWRPRWFVLDTETQVLSYHYISSNAPPLIETKKPMFGGRKPDTVTESQLEPATHAMGFQAESEQGVELKDCVVRIEDGLSIPEKFLFAFSITPPEAVGVVPWYLSATTQEARFMWVGMLAELTGLVKDEEALKDACGDVPMEDFVSMVGFDKDALVSARESESEDHT